MKRVFAIVGMLLVVSCNNGPNKGKDGYIFSNKQYEQSPVTVSIATYKSQEQLYQVAKSKGANYPNVVAFSVLTTKKDTCTIHMIDPSVRYEPEFVGHEFLHCVYGQWHINNDS